MTPYHLTTDARTEPREIEHSHPTFSWRLRSDEDRTPLSHRIQVWAQPQPGCPDGFRWDSGSVEGSTVRTRYNGPTLSPRTSYSWSVTTTDDTGVTDSATSFFETGLMGDAWRELGASWITRDPRPPFDDDGRLPAAPTGTTIPRSWQTMYSAAPLQLRRTFRVEHPIVAARLYVTAHGVYRAHVNGVRAGLDELAPGWTRYESALEYQAYDVTESVTQGTNVLAAEVADGWWSGFLGYNSRSHADQYGERPELICILEVTHPDLSTTVVSSDREWREHAGATVMADLLMGEYQDRRADTVGWLRPAFDDSAWREAQVVDDGTSTLRGQTAPPVRAIEEVSPISIRRLPEGSTVVDFGQNLVGRVRLTLTGYEPGSLVELVHGEMLDQGRVYRANLRTAEARDVVVTAGHDERFEPAFTVHGFRYVEIVGLTQPLRTEDIVAVVLSSDVDDTGSFSSSSPLVNQLYSNIRWGQRGNFVAVPTDCPQRDERLGWTADTQIFAPTAAFNSDVEAFRGRWLEDLSASQNENGAVPDVVPVPPTSSNFATGAPGWGDSAVIVPWHLYTVYGDLALLERRYPSMRAWVEWVASQNPDGLWRNAVGNNYGDWLSVDADTPPYVVAAAYRVRSTDLLALAAAELGQDDDAAHYRDEARRLRTLFQRTYVAEDGRVHGETQTGYLFALAWHLVPDDLRLQVAKHLVRDLRERGERLTTGFLGVSLLCPTLVEIGETDLAYELLLQEEFPSWGYSIRHGATTIWERWDGWTSHGGFQSVEMNSFNHYSLGSVGEWLYRHVAGIDQTPGTVGFARPLIAPKLTRLLDHVSAHFESPRGRIEVAWARHDDVVTVDVVIPPGATARVELPGQIHEGVTGRRSFTVDESPRRSLIGARR